MGNWHCIPSSCAEVVYQPYESQKVRWRYGSEPWQEIIGADDYSITPTYNRAVFCEWQYDMGYSVLSHGLFTPSSPSQGCNGSMAAQSRCARRRENPQLVFSDSRVQTGFYAPISKYRLSDYAEANYPCSNAALNYSPLLCTKPKGYRKVEIFAYKTPSSPNPEWITGWLGTRNYLPGYMLQVPSGGEFSVIFNPSTNMYVGVIPSGSGWSYFNFVPTSNVAPTNYLFKIYKNGVVVYQETRSTIPQVEKIPCSLSNVRQSVEVKKIPYLQKVEVVPWEYILTPSEATNDPLPIIQTVPIPAECLNIYNNLVINDAVPINYFITQICSAPGCPPPEYEVLCDCQCEKCPDYTCPIECGDFICCYNDYGVSVQTIAKDKYCGGES